MIRKTILLATAVLLAAVTARAADDDGEMKAAQQSLRDAHSHLKAANRDYKGHRKTAVDLVERALDEVRQGLAVEAKHDTQRERRMDRREDRLERREDRIERRLERLDERDDD